MAGPATAAANQRCRADAAKRERILDAAHRVFLESGYGAASMEAIARTAGVAKQTVYAHFGTKAGLFGWIMRERCDWLLEPLPPAETDHDPVIALEAIAARFLEIVLAPEALARFRLVMAEHARFPELAQVFFAAGPARATAGLAAYLAHLDRRRLMHVPDPLEAASQFFGMIRGDLYLRHLLGLETEQQPHRIRAVVQAAVRAFVAAHRPLQGNGA
jgi:AcrR family transcriptional regulator